MFNAWVPWAAFGVVVAGMLAIDLGVSHRRLQALSLREAAVWSAVWILLALVFNLGVYLVRGPEPALEFLTAYLIEKSLSVDNIFVFLMIFSYFAVPAAYQRRVLLWGILGALLMRAVFIAAGITLLHAFHWIIYVFGAVLIATGVKFLTKQDESVHPERNPVLRLIRRRVPLAPDFEGQRFFVVRDGRFIGTPLLVVLAVIESTDLVFAVDSIPAVLAISQDPFIVYTSNVFAILGLRALYFLLAGVMDLFYYLRHGLGAVLTFVGLKMVASSFYKIPTGLSLLVIMVVLAGAVVASLRRGRGAGEHARAVHEGVPTP
ncbi:MAG: TerC family protein [Armatimonadota bacterium]|nr:TerC family protein [Armatimonadota bacterium]